jgi:undecaprenyl-diphosphatase
MSFWESLLLGVLQGLTEFLPVSSSGHIVIGKELFGIRSTDLSFEIVVHAATVLSTIVVFRREIAILIKEFFQFRMNSGTRYILQILISMIPVMIVGLFFKEKVETLFGEGLLVVGLALVITAVLLAISQFRKPGDKEVTYKNALIIGVSQAVAVIPGLSRSGATISTGLILGIKKDQVAKFSFLMVLIPVLGETFLELLSGNLSHGASSTGALELVAGFLAAFITGLIACKLMVSLVRRAKLTGFALYCAILGFVCLLVEIL